ncbi:molecular chaperone [Vibrio cholerae]|uniref:molecular chaperone n=1 Tax=Vibrio cholerae TaxID=666 RepID=UPI0011DBC681|nr:molecular chaperone [Vibrio cholerae]EGR2498366.1 molecular chaperone [Vibrio cholerae]TXZ52901.1 molecular chaperone [Vibrio cholerae]GHW23599.1 molecular chaperone [Vibrio cholerae]
MMNGIFLNSSKIGDYINDRLCPDGQSVNIFQSLVEKIEKYDLSSNVSLTSRLSVCRELIKQADTVNTEEEISSALQEAIDQASVELNALNAWTEGGKEVISPILEIMFEDIMNDESNEKKQEDLMQILVFDLLIHQDEWGINFNSAFGDNANSYFGYITENFGSGMHSVYQGNQNHTPEVIVQWFLNNVVDNLNNMIGNDIPTTSITAKLVDYFSQNENRDILALLAENYDLTDAISHADSTSTHISPSLKLFLMGQAAYIGLIDENQWESFIKSDVDEIKEFLGLDHDSPNRDISDWLVEQDIGWTYDKSNQLDYNKGFAGGIPIEKLKEFFNRFPPRVLTDDELKKINRIGDNVKMIMQTLKYWFQIMRDERVAIARNI